MKKKIAILLIIVLNCMFLFSSCGDIANIFHKHDWSRWEFHSESSNNCEDKIYKRTCEACNMIEFKSGSHEYRERYKSDDKYHWFECDNCDEKIDKEKHRYVGSKCSICGRKSGQSSSIEDKDNIGDFDPNEQVTIKFYHTMGENLRTKLDFHIEKFNELYPNITIEHMQIGSYDDVRNQITTELRVDAQPNIAYCYPDHVAHYNLALAVLTLDDFINSTKEITRADGSTEILGLTAEQIADFIPAYYDEGRQFGDGKMYAMPFSKSTEVLYYNKTFFDANGLTPPTTWDELEALCARIKELDPKSIPLGYDSEANWFITMTEQLGTPYTSATGDDHFLFDTAENRAFCAEFREWYLKGYVTTQEILGSYTSSLFTSEEETKSYMSIGSSAGTTHQRPTKNDDGTYPFEVGIVPIPQVNPNNPKVISQGPSVCVFDGHSAAEETASWLFVKYLTTSVELQADFSMTSGYMPVIKSVNTNPAYKRYLDSADGGDYIAALSAKVCLEQADAYFVSPAFYGSSDARDQVGILLQACLVIAPNVADPMAEIKRLFEVAVRECEYRQ